VRVARSKGVVWQKAPDIKNRLKDICSHLGMDWIKTSRLYVYRSYNSSARAYARTWGFPRVWQLALKQKPAYVIEVLSESFDKLGSNEQDKILVHELAHIPRNFSGSLLSHIKKRGVRNFHDRVERLISSLILNRKI